MVRPLEGRGGKQVDVQDKVNINVAPNVSNLFYAIYKP